MKSLFVLPALLLGLLGCAGIPLSKDECNATLFPTAHEHELCLKAASDYEIEQDELADKRLIKRDALIVFLNGCDSKDHLALVEIKTTRRGCLPSKREQRRSMRERGYKYTHENVCQKARKSYFKCWDKQAFIDALNRGY